MPLLWLSIAFITGLLLGAWLPVNWVIWSMLSTLSFGFGLIEPRLSQIAPMLKRWRERCPLPAGVVLAALLFGAARYQTAQPSWEPSDLAWYNDDNAVRLRGQIDSPPDYRDRSVLLRIKTSQLTPLTSDPSEAIAQIVHGDLLVHLPAGGDWQYGDVLELEGKPVTPPENEDFSYRDYLARQGIYTYMLYPRVRLVRRGAGNPIMAVIYNLRQNAYSTVNQFFPQPESALLAGILLGIESDIPADVDRAFKNTGTTHIIAISGFNIAILAGLFAGFSAYLLPRRWSLPVSLTGIAFYVLLVGAQPPVVRAAIMGSVGLFGHQIGRRQSGVNTLFFTAAVMSFLNPLIPGDAGFQLSFAATLGLVLFAEPMQESFIRLAERRLSTENARRLAKPVGEYLLFTLAAQITTLPIIAYHFQRISLSSILANPLILPPQPLVMILGGIAVAVGLILPPLGQLLSYLTWPLLAYTIRMVELLAQIPGGAIILGKISVSFILFFYAILLGLKLGWHRLASLRSKLKLTPALLILGLGLLSAVTWQTVLRSPNGKLHLSVLDVDSGPAYLLQTSGGHTILINGGARASQLSDHLGRRLPIFNRSLDALIITSRAAAPLEGLPATLERFPVQQVLWNEEAAGHRNGRQLQSHFYEESIPTNILEAGQTLDLGYGAALHVLVDTDEGIALLLEWRNFRALIPGGVQPDDLIHQENENIAGLSALLLASEDLKELSAEAWTELQPVITLWPGSEADFAPNPQRWVSVSQHGWIVITTDGNQMWVEAKR